jgi:hypothetical protein
MAGKDTVTQTGETSGEIAKPTMFERWIKALDSEAQATEAFSDTSEITANVAEAILSAPTMADAFAVQDAGLPSGKDLVDVEHEIKTFEVIKGDAKYSEHSLGYYFRVHAARLEDGAEFTYSVGAPNVMLVMHRLRQENQIPGAEVVIRSKPTANGALLTLRPVPRRAL